MIRKEGQERARVAHWQKLYTSVIQQVEITAEKRD